MTKHIYQTPAIECVQLESYAIMNAGSPTIITNGGNASTLEDGTRIAD